MTRLGNNGGICYRKGRDMSHRVEIFSAAPVANPKPFLPGTFEAGIVPFTFRTQSIDSFELQTVPVNGETIIIGDRLVLGTAAIFLAVVPVFVVTGTLAGFSLTERTAVFLT